MAAKSLIFFIISFFWLNLYSPSYRSRHAFSPDVLPPACIMPSVSARFMPPPDGGMVSAHHAARPIRIRVKRMNTRANTLRSKPLSAGRQAQISIYGLNLVSHRSVRRRSYAQGSVSAGLLTRSGGGAFPIPRDQWLKRAAPRFRPRRRSIQQRELYGPFTRFPFDSPTGRTGLRETDTAAKVIYLIDTSKYNPTSCPQPHCTSPHATRTLQKTGAHHCAPDTH